MFMNVFYGIRAISIGQLFKKQRLLGAIEYLYRTLYASADGIFLFNGFCEFYFHRALIPMKKMIQTILTLLLVVLLVETAATIAFYFISAHIMKNQLNLE